MKFFVKRTLKMVSYGTLVVAGLVASGAWHSAQDKSSQSFPGSKEISNALLIGIAHADVPMCGGYGCTATPSGAGDGGGDCGDGSGDDCN